MAAGRAPGASAGNDQPPVGQSPARTSDGTNDRTNDGKSAGETAPIARPERAFPLVRHLSCRLTPQLLRWRVHANQVTAAWILLGLAGDLCFWAGGRRAGVAGALCFVASYVLDNCDGEVARIGRQESRFGDLLGEFGDWLVSSLLFVALAAAAARADGRAVWWWLAGFAVAGASLNLAVMTIFKDDQRLHAPEAAGEAPPPLTGAQLARATGPRDVAVRPSWLDHLVYVSRELFKADFCFLLLALALGDVLWLLLPAGAVGAPLYWIPALFERVRRYHV